MLGHEANVESSAAGRNPASRRNWHSFMGLFAGLMERVEFLMVATDRDVVMVQCVEVRSQLLPIIAKIGLVERRLVLNGLPIFVYKLPMLLDQMIVIRSYFGELVAEALVHQSNCNRRIEPKRALPHDSPTDGSEAAARCADDERDRRDKHL
jgi:hypothetical protein